MTAVSNRLNVLLVTDNSDGTDLIRRAFRRISHFIQLTAADEAAVAEPGGGSLSPAPDVLLFAGTASARALRGWRQQSAFKSLPAIVLDAPMSATNSALARELNAACCPIMPDLRGMTAALEEALCQALRLAWDGLMQPRAGAAQPSLDHVGAAPIRVWT